MEWKVPLFKTYWEESDVESVKKVIERGTFWATGPEITEFEKELASFIGKKYAVLFNSWTSGIHAMLSAYGFKNKEVIIPSYTFIATGNAVILSGNKPVFAEIEDETFSLDYEDVVKRITPNTAAVMPIDCAGCPSRDKEKLKKLCEEKGILFIEEAAQSFGSSINGKMTGSFGNASGFSFCQNKLITTGEGGVALTDDQELYEKMKLLRSHGRFEEVDGDYFSKADDNDYIEVGYNFRMPSMNAALGLSQLKRFDKVKKMRQACAKKLSEGLSGIKGLKVPVIPQGFEHVFLDYTVLFEDNETRNALQKHMTKKGIMTKVYFEPIHLKTIFKKKYGCKVGDLPFTESVSSRVLTLPMFPHMSEEELNYIIDSIKEFFDNK